MQQSQAAEPARIEALDGVRGLAILLVVMMHSLFFGVPLPGAPPLDQSSAYVRLAGLGWCGVDVFFVLSGFLITRILVRSRGAPHYFRNFYVRRSLRIFPLYYAVIVLLLYVLPRPAAALSEQLSYLFYYQNFLLAVGGGQPEDVARTITWSLAIEEQFYLIWPALVGFVAPRRLARVCWLLIAVAIVLRFACVHFGWFMPDGRTLTHFVTPCRIDTLAAGALLAVLPLPPIWLGRLLAVAGASWLITIAFVTGNSVPYFPDYQRWGLIAAAMMAAGVLVLGRHDGGFAALCRHRALASLGRYSYCVYLTHFLVIEKLAFTVYGEVGAPPAAWQTWLLEHVGTGVLLVAFTALCLLVSWLVAFVSWHLFEKWFLRLKGAFPSGG